VLPPKGDTLEHATSADAFPSSQSLKAYGYPERVFYGEEGKAGQRCIHALEKSGLDFQEILVLV